MFKNKIILLKVILKALISKHIIITIFLSLKLLKCGVINFDLNTNADAITEIIQYNYFITKNINMTHNNMTLKIQCQVG